MAERMEAQHNVISELLTRAEAALPAWQRTARAGDGDALAADLGELHARLEEHLDEEETHVLPIVGQNITPTEWDELVSRS
jgi:hemerythrin-like domain-containing protein